MDLNCILIINDQSEIVAIKITRGNVDNRKAFEAMFTSMCHALAMLL